MWPFSRRPSPRGGGARLTANELAARLDRARLPRHVAIIMDGNGRWARERHLPRVAGHRVGIDSAREAVKACHELGIPYLTLYAFSTENWSRPRAEVEALMRLIEEYVQRELDMLLENDIRLNVIGRVADLPARVATTLREATERTRSNQTLWFNVALSYSGRQELVDAFRTLEERCRRGDLDPATMEARDVESALQTAGQPDPDLLIRTSGEMRLSNFLLWQAAYAEIYVTKTLWPDFRRREFLEALLDYQGRERRFGRINE